MAERKRDDQDLGLADERTSRRREVAEKRGGYRGSRVTSIPKRPEGPAPDHNAPADGSRDASGDREPSSLLTKRRREPDADEDVNVDEE